MNLYVRDGGEPAELPFSAYDSDGRIWTDLTKNPEGQAACGFSKVPPEPVYNPQTQALAWVNGAWVVTALPKPTLDEVKATAIAAAAAQFATRMAAGAPYAGQAVQLDDGSQARVTAIGTTALAAASSAVPWPDGYAKGWITTSGVRIPLPAASDGLTFAASIGGYYANLVQHEHDLELAINAAGDAAGVSAVDVTAGWPT